MNLLIDMGAIKSGGGAQLALNFLDDIEKYNLCENVSLLLPDIGPLSKKSNINKYVSVYRSPLNYFKRFIFEKFEIPIIINKHNIDTIFTFFGTGLPHSKKVKSVVSVAYPIICYPDSDYWKYIDFKNKIIKKIFNCFRRQRLTNASIIITETEIMKKRVAKFVNFDEEKIVVLPPTPTKYISERKRDFDKFNGKFLFLSGNDIHKNLWELHDVAKFLYSMDFNDYEFILSVTKEEFLNNINIKDDYILSKFKFLGRIFPDRIQDVYDMCDVMVSLSDLESFSNNYMEAWKVGIPLLVSDRDFSRHICQESAIYTEPHNAKDVAEKMIWIARNKEIRRNLVTFGKERLNSLPERSKRMDCLWNILINRE